MGGKLETWSTEPIPKGGQVFISLTATSLCSALWESGSSPHLSLREYSFGMVKWGPGGKEFAEKSLGEAGGR